MNKDLIDVWLRSDYLRKRIPDKQKAYSMIASAEDTIGVVKKIPLTSQSAIIIFRETYESIRQLGDAAWWLQGYEPRNHEICMDILKEMDITQKILLNHLNRFKQIRNDINYRGFKATVAQAKEILNVWNVCSKDIIILLKKL